MHIYTHIYIYICIYFFTHIYKQIDRHKTHMNILSLGGLTGRVNPIYICICICIYIYMTCVCVCVYICVCVLPFLSLGWPCSSCLRNRRGGRGDIQLIIRRWWAWLSKMRSNQAYATGSSPILTNSLPLISTALSWATNRHKRTRRFLFPSRARDQLYIKRAAPYVNAPSCPLSCIYTSLILAVLSPPSQPLAHHSFSILVYWESTFSQQEECPR